MKNIIVIVIFVLCAGLSACKKRAPETVPQPKAVEPAETAAISTSAVKSVGLLDAPGNYLKTTVGQVGKAREARALFEKTAKQELESTDLNNTGGN